MRQSYGRTGKFIPALRIYVLYPYIVTKPLKEETSLESPANDLPRTFQKKLKWATLCLN